MKKIQKLSLNEMVNQLQTVSEVELMAMIGGSDYKGTCFFDCLLSVMESKGLQGSRNDMLISYGKTYIEIDNPNMGYGQDASYTNKDYRNHAEAGIQDYNNRIVDFANRYFEDAVLLSPGQVATGQTNGHNYIILNVNLGQDGIDHAVMYRGYDSGTGKFTVYDASSNTTYEVKNDQVKSALGIK